MQKISKYATGMFACSEQAGKWMFCGAPFDVVNNAVDAQKYRFSSDTAQNTRRNLGIQNSFVLGHVGRFRIEKNHEFLIDIFAAVVQKRPDSVLLLAGDGDLQAEIQAKVHRLGLADKVRFLGACSNVDELMQAMDVFVFPSLYEGLPVTMVEAQAAGLPCVISDTIPPECILTDRVTRKRLQDSPESWAEEILKYQGQQHADTCREICAAGFDIAENARKLQGFYLDAWTGERT